MSSGIPRRAGNKTKAATRERSYLRGQERKAKRREENEKRAQLNRTLRSEGVIIPPVDVYRKGGTKRTRVADRSLPPRKGDYSRTVTIRTMRNRQQDTYGWSVSCLNCPFHKIFLWEHGFTPITLPDGSVFDIAYEAARDRAQEHVCTPSQWSFSEDNFPATARATNSRKTGKQRSMAKGNV